MPTTPSLSPLSPLFGGTLDEVVAVERLEQRRRGAALFAGAVLIATGVLITSVVANDTGGGRFVGNACRKYIP